MLITRVFRFSTQNQQVIVRGATFQIGARYALPVVKQDSVPVLQRRELQQSELWTQRPFQGDLLLPIFNLNDAKYTGQAVKLEEGYEMYLDLRRDLLHRLVMFTRNLYKQITNRTLTLDKVSASGHKNRRQKGLGMARQGQRQKPGWNKGVKAHGRKARSLRLEMPKKVRLQGLKVGLTAALFDRRIRIIENEEVTNGRTKELLKSIHSFVEEDSVLIITGYKVDESFERAAKNLQQISLCQPDRVNIIKLMTSKWILITRDGLEQLTQHLIDRTVNCYTRGKVAHPSQDQKREALGLITSEQPKVLYDPTKPLDLKFKILKEYMSEYEKLKQEGKLDKFIQDMPKTRRNKGLINSVHE